MRVFNVVIAALILAPGISQAKAADQFEHLRDRLLSGQPTVSIIDLNQCKQKAGETTGAAKPIGGLLIRDFMITPEPNPKIAYANQHLTVMPDGLAVLELIQYRITADDRAIITAHRLSPENYKPLSDPRVFECPLGTGLHFEPETGIIPIMNN
ncbi:VirK family protein [Phyllobacterium phragmitis]|uniref:VirK protein n=1 Tax=Phyllobacterium phragmitis TaxID=2670329 RepID=A0ABQ0GYS0_9HYPH